ncbi:MAG: CRISPR-associated helicase Cas3' [bacterium]
MNNSGPINIFSFWGKAEKDGTAFHPAVCHMLDVGIVAGELLRAFPPRLQDRILSIFGPLGKDGLAFFVSLHDIGKISPGFQKKREDLCVPLQEMSFGLPRFSEKSHGKIVAHRLPDILIEDLTCPGESARILSTVLAAHHGIFVSSEPVRDGGKEWEEARRQAVRFLAGVFRIETLETVFLSSTADALILAGLITVADWLGSSEGHFPYTGNTQVDISSYVIERTGRAKALIRELGMDSVSLIEKPFKDLFPFPANACQEAVMEAISQLRHPMFLIVESPMGSGKTEAAQAAFSYLSPHNSLRGMYYALPTQATGNAMFNRMIPFLKKLDLTGQIELHLLHANADLNSDYEELKTRSINDDDPKGEGNVVASSWFTARKKGILASYATGTIDQALMAALRVRHFFLRLFGLSGKLVVLDEVHAYDAYMTEEITRLIGWLAHCETSVILLSATLPQKRRQQLLHSFSPGAEIPPDIVYPCVIGVDGTGKVIARNISGPQSPPVTFAPVVCEQEDKATVIVRMLKEKLTEGGCAACILNTVSEAQNVYEAVKADFDGTDTILFHSRFTLKRRLEIEDQILSRYKKDGSRPPKGIVIATQVLEQSLDLDFDLMVSDLSPIDLLFQRAGRLHRHDNRRPPLLKDRIIYVLMPDIIAGKTEFGGSKFVYFPDILTRTAYLLIDRNTYQPRIVSIPDGISPLIEMVYGGEDILVSERLQQEMEKWDEGRLGKEYASRYAAQLAAVRDAWSCINDPQYLAEIPNDNDDEKSISTRIARPNVTLILAEEGADLTVQNKEDAKRLYAHSISTDNGHLVRHFLEQEPPPGWKDAPLLRHCRVLVMKEGRASVGNRVVLYDREEEVGLRILKESR